MASRRAGVSSEPNLHQHSSGRGECDDSRGAWSGQASFAKSRYGASRNSELLVLPEPLFFVSRGYTENGNTERVGWAREVMASDLRGARTNETRKALTTRVS